MGIFKWIAGGLGFALSGPIGALIGIVIGSLIEKGGEQPTKHRNFSGGAGHGTQTIQGDFKVSLLVLMAAVMKADGKVVKSELDYVKLQLGRMMGQEAVPEMLTILRDLLKKDIPLPEVCKQIAENMDYSYRLQLLHLLFGISQADGVVDDSEVKVIEQIAFYLDITREDLASIKAMFVKDTQSAYKVLEIESSATDAEVKKAYRKMAVKYHPDKVAHLGEHLQEQAKEKFQELNKAYEEIKSERGFH